MFTPLDRRYPGVCSALLLAAISAAWADAPLAVEARTPPADAVTTDSGLRFIVLAPGTGDESPTAGAEVLARYTGWTLHGVEFQSTGSRPERLRLDQILPGWREALLQMKVGEKRRLWIPESLAYRGMTGMPRGELIFDLELIDVILPPKPPRVPDNLDAPPEDAETSATGLVTWVLEEGDGTRYPVATDVVVVHYTGWTSDGRMFDTSFKDEGDPALVEVRRLIPGWAEGIQLMVEGEKRRFWIPQHLAYRGRPGHPRGMLVFDVELVRIR